MTTQELKRKLTAILSADVKGYSRFMGEDEKGTVRMLNAYREVMANLIQQHHGRVVDWQPLRRHTGINTGLVELG